MTGAEIFGLILLSIVVFFFSVGAIFIIVDTYKARRNKRAMDKKIAEDRVIAIEGMAGDTKDKINTLINIIRTFAMREGEADAKIIEEINEIKRRQVRLFESVNCIQTSEPYAPTAPTVKGQLVNDIKVIMESIGVSMGSWAEVLAEGLYLKGWTIGDTPKVKNTLHNDTK